MQDKIITIYLLDTSRQIDLSPADIKIIKKIPLHGVIRLSQFKPTDGRTLLELLNKGIVNALDVELSWNEFGDLVKQLDPEVSFTRFGDLIKEMVTESGKA